MDCAPVFYDLHCSPQDYLKPMLYMMKSIESVGQKLNNIFPLRSEIAPQHFRIDTVTLLYFCMTKDHGKVADYTRYGNLVEKADELWEFFFQTDMSCFLGKHTSFDHQIETDGVSCSILMKLTEQMGVRYKKQKTAKIKQREVYIDEIEDCLTLRNKNVVAIDPNLSDLIYCVDSDQHDQIKFRYTQDTRRKETKSKKYRNYLQTRKNEIVAGKHVVKWEAELRVYNKKTTDFESFKKYVAKKNELNRRLAPFHNEYIFRKLKLGSYIRRQITENRLLKQVISQEQVSITFDS